ncbi:MAG TPA: acetyltransferase [Terriglobia bacterium]|nr:acetyltransferase [Terriglobia bacterium]
MSIQKGIYVIGAGGHAKVVISTLRAAGHEVAEVLDDDSRRWGGQILGSPIAGPCSKLQELSSPQALIAIGSNEARKELARRFPKVEWITIVHPNAYVHSSVRLGPGTVVFAGAMVQPDATIGAHCIINTGASVDHDCVLADYVQVAPGAHLGGAVRLAEGVFAGIGCAINPCRSVGSWTIVGSGGVVTKDLEGGVVAVGVPARPIKKR